MYAIEHNTIFLEQPESRDLFLVFTGITQQVMGLGPLEFLQRTRLTDRNVIVLRDPLVAGFLFGCSDTLGTFEHMVAWLAGHMKRLGAERSFAVGISSGSLAAMVAANRLGCLASMVFGPRWHSLQAIGEGAAAATATPVAFTWATYGGILANRLTNWARRKVSRPVRSNHPRCVFEAGMTDFEPFLAALASGESSLPHHVYYCPRSKPDRAVVSILQRRTRANLVLHQVEPPASYPRKYMRFEDWEHSVLPMLAASGDLAALFP